MDYGSHWMAIIGTMHWAHISFWPSNCLNSSKIGQALYLDSNLQAGERSIWHTETAQEHDDRASSILDPTKSPRLHRFINCDTSRPLLWTSDSYSPAHAFTISTAWPETATHLCTMKSKWQLFQWTVLGHTLLLQPLHQPISCVATSHV